MTLRSRHGWLLAALLTSTSAECGCGDDGDTASSSGGGGSTTEGPGGATATSSDQASSSDVATTSTSSGDTGGSGGGTGGSGGGATGAPLGLVFEGTPLDGDPVALPLPGLPEGSTHLEGSSFIVHTCVGPDCFEGGDSLAFLATADAQGDFLIDPVVDATAGPDPAAEVNAYYHLETFLERFRALGFAGLDHPAHIIVDAWLDFDGDGEPDEFFAGATDLFGHPGILMGTVGDRNLAYDPDVFGHEFTHIVTGEAGALALETSLDSTGLSLAAGALREGTADFFAASFMDDPEIGEYSTAPLGAPYFSSVDNDATCPLYLVGEAHADGQVWSATLWDLREIVGADVLEQALFDVLRDLPIHATLPDAFDALRTRLGDDVDDDALAAFDEVLEARGIATCSGVAPLDVGTAAPLFLLAPGEEVWDDEHAATLPFDEMPAALQFRIDVPEGLYGLSLEVVPYDASTIEPERARIHVRVGDPVAWSHDGEEASVVDDAAEWGTLVLDGASSPPLAPGPIFVSIAYAGDVADYAVVQAREIEAPEDAPGAR